MRERIEALLEGTITAADHVRLEAELLVTPDARECYYERLEMDLLLEEEAGEAKAAPNIIPLWSKGWVKVAALVLLTGIALALFWSPQTETRQEASATGFAVVSGSLDANWEGPQQFGKGDLLPGGDLELMSGFVQFELFSGVSLVLEGPARFAIQSAMEMEVRQGKLRAQVPAAARGFRVLLADGQVVDLGTEFALSVDNSGQEMHVIDGEVELHPSNAEVQALGTGEAISWNEANQWRRFPSDASRFLGHSDLESQLRDSQSSRRERWKAFTQQLRRDPRLLGYYPMDQPDTWRRTLFNEAQSTQHLELDGAIVAAQRVPGRWAGTSALDFSPTGSRVRVHIPGEYGSLTFACWVKIDSLDRWYNSLFLTDSYEVGEPHWQIMDDGRLFFSIRAKDEGQPHYICHSPSFWSPARSGKWLHLATRFDQDKAEVTHFLNGKVLSRERIPSEFLVEKVRFGGATIGNWSEPGRNDPKFAIRNFNGSIGEFAIFAAALPDEEIARHYDLGRP